VAEILNQAGNPVYDEGYRAGQVALAEKLLADLAPRWGGSLIPEYIRGACEAVIRGEDIPVPKPPRVGAASAAPVAIEEEVVDVGIAEEIPEEELAPASEENAAVEGAEPEDDEDEDPAA
jgi:hypothetical protein